MRPPVADTLSALAAWVAVACLPACPLVKVVDTGAPSTSKVTAGWLTKPARKLPAVLAPTAHATATDFSEGAAAMSSAARLEIARLALERSPQLLRTAGSGVGVVPPRSCPADAAIVAF